MISSERSSARPRLLNSSEGGSFRLLADDFDDFKSVLTQKFEREMTTHSTYADDRALMGICLIGMG